MRKASPARGLVRGRVDVTATGTEFSTAAGGFAVYADEDKIKLVRKHTAGKVDVVQLSFKDLQMKPDKNIEVEDRDIIFVETNKPGDSIERHNGDSQPRVQRCP